MTAWAHLHLPRLRSGETPNVISLKTPGEKIDYVSAVEMSNPTFRVHERGRERCLEYGVRNVHAWVVGDVEGVSYNCRQMDLSSAWRRAVYDPWKGDSFVDADTLEPVHSASRAVLTGKVVYYQP
jgi:hypothetical protein